MSAYAKVFRPTAALYAALIFPGMAAPTPHFDDIHSRNVILAGSVTSPVPVQLHGTVASVDKAGHRIGVSDLSGAEVYWREAAQHCAVDPSVDLSSVTVGQRVALLLTRGTNGKYYVRKISDN